MGLSIRPSGTRYPVNCARFRRYRHAAIECPHRTGPPSPSRHPVLRRSFGSRGRGSGPQPSESGCTVGPLGIRSRSQRHRRDRTAANPRPPFRGLSLCSAKYLIAARPMHPLASATSSVVIGPLSTLSSLLGAPPTATATAPRSGVSQSGSVQAPAQVASAPTLVPTRANKQPLNVALPLLAAGSSQPPAPVQPLSRGSTQLMDVPRQLWFISTAARLPTAPICTLYRGPNGLWAAGVIRGLMALPDQIAHLPPPPAYCALGKPLSMNDALDYLAGHCGGDPRQYLASPHCHLRPGQG